MYVYQSTFDEHLSTDIIDTAKNYVLCNVTLSRVNISINKMIRVIIW